MITKEAIEALRKSLNGVAYISVAEATDALPAAVAAMPGPAVEVEPLLAPPVKLAFNKAGNCTTFRRDQAERLEGEWVWLIEATNGMNDPVYYSHTNIEHNASAMEEIMSVSSADHEEAHELLKSFTGAEGGTQQVDWYGLRDKIAAGIAKAKYDQRQIDRRILSALTPAPDLASENESLPQDVVNLVIAAREFWDVAMDESDESAALDCALEAFSSRVPYENELAEDRAALERT
jgi:hypothetical protein